MALDVSMILRLVDKVSAPAKKAAAAIGSIGAASKMTGRDAAKAANGIQKVTAAANRIDDRKANRLWRTWRRLSILARRPSLLVARTKIDDRALRKWGDGIAGTLGGIVGRAAAGIGIGIGAAAYGLTSLMGMMIELGKKAEPGFAAKWTAQTDKLSATWQSFVLNVGQAGVFDWLIQKITVLNGWLDKMAASGQLNKWANDIAAAMISIGEWLASIDWVGVATDVGEIASAIGSVVSAVAAMGGGGISGIFNMAIVAIIGKIALSMYGLAAALGVVSIAGAPLWLVVAVIAAIAAGAFLIYRNWDAISAWFVTKWGEVKAVFVAAGQNIVASLTSMWVRAKGAFMAGVNAIWNMLPNWMKMIFNGATFSIRLVGNLLSGQGLGSATTNAARGAGLLPPQAGQRPKPVNGVKTAMSLDNRMRIEVATAPGVSAAVKPVSTADTTWNISRSKRGEAMAERFA